MPDNPQFVPTEIWGIDKQLSLGEGKFFKGAPNTGVCGGAEESPELPAALAQVNHYQGAKPPGE